jgi:hypothetical protein
MCLWVIILCSVVGGLLVLGITAFIVKKKCLNKKSANEYSQMGN